MYFKSFEINLFINKIFQWITIIFNKIEQKIYNQKIKIAIITNLCICTHII
jgi:hypothetical protein